MKRIEPEDHVRPIRLKAKRIKSGRWIYWDILHNFPHPRRIIDIWTVCQSICMKDKRRKEVYEGDILKRGRSKFIIKFKDNIFIEELISTGKQQPIKKDYSKAEVIGNIHDKKQIKRK